MRLLARGHTIEFPRRPLIMGIVNLSPDSFSGDGLSTTEAAFTQAYQMIADGADIIDLGAESARTNRAPISEEEEIDRLSSFIVRWRAEFPSVSAAISHLPSAPPPSALDLRPSPPPPALSPQPSAFPPRPSAPPLLSLNTWRPAVARAVLPLGGDLLNDIGALPTGENARTCAATGAALLIMHTVGTPKVPHTHIAYDDVMTRLETFFTEKIALALAAGLSRDAILLDPGIDFAKQRDDNLRIYRELPRLHRFERPILLPISRKTVIGDVLNLPHAPDRDPGTIASLVQGQLRGAHIFRVHNVRAAAQAVRTIEAVEQA
jgi:dihydropteroate synthase